MKKSAVKIAMYLNYFVFAILLNSVGIVILKSQANYGVDEVQASVLEAFKDLPIAIVSFFVASFLPRIGYKKSMLVGLALVTLACLSMYFGNSFNSAKLLFATVGVSFALIKVSVYSLIGSVTDNQKEHNSLMSSIEGVFMIGIALAYFLFPAFNSESNPNSWLNVYWLLAGLSIVSFLFLFFIDFQESNDIKGVHLWDDFAQMFGLLAKLLTIISVSYTHLRAHETEL
jgi:MFS family permease